MATTTNPSGPSFTLYRLRPAGIERVTPRWHRLSFILPDAPAIAPGQFVTVKSEGDGAPLLPRPFSVHRWDPAERRLTLLIEERGPATRSLLTTVTSECQLMVPLGTGFELKAGGTHVLVGGGIGVAPLYHLAESLFRAGQKPIILAGFRKDDDVCSDPDLAPAGVPVVKSVDCGTSCFEGSVVELLRARINPPNLHVLPIHVYACGPHGMLRALADLCSSFGAGLQVSLEGIMGCGVGACQGCSCETKEGRELLCRCGPVFPAERVVWHA